MGLTLPWPKLDVPTLQLPRMDSGSSLLLASISETAAAADTQHISVHCKSSQTSSPSATPKASFTKVPTSLLGPGDSEPASFVQDSSMNFVYKQRHGPRMLHLLHLPSEAALRLVEAVQCGMMTVQLGVLSSPPARHIQQLHSSLLGTQEAAHTAQSRGMALLQALRLPRLLQRHRGEERHKVVEVVDDPKKAAMQLHLQGLEHERVMDLAAAEKCYEQAALLDPSNTEWLCRWSKQLTDRTYADGTTEQQARECNQLAMEIAERALALDGNDCLAHIAACISKGRLALFSDNKAKVLLAKSAQENAVIALCLDPTSDLAHHLYGRWHYEMAGQNVLVRTLVKILFGADLPPGTYHEALEAFQAAASLRPDRVIHWVEMGRAEVKMGRSQDAMEHLRLALELDNEDINAYQEKIIGREVLQQLEREAARGLPRW